MRSVKPLRTICQNTVILSTLAALFGLAGPTWADRYGNDPVEQLRRALRASPSSLLANDAELAKRLRSIKQPDEQIKVYQEARERDLSKHVAAIRSIGDMSRALMLQEWMSVGDTDERAGAVRRVRSQLAERFRKAVAHVLETGSDSAKIAVMSVLSEMPVTVRWEEYPGGVARVFAPELAKLAKSDHRLIIRVTAARTLGQIFPDPKIAAPALESILKSSDAEERRAAASGLLGIIRLTSDLATGSKTGGKPEATPSDVIQAGLAVIPGAGLGLVDADVIVRRYSAAAIQQSLATLVYLDPTRNMAAFAGDTRSDRGPAPGDLRAEIVPMILAVKRQADVLRRAASDSDPDVRLRTRRALEEIGAVRQHWNRSTSDQSFISSQFPDVETPRPPTRVEKNEADSIPDTILAVLRAALPALIDGVSDPFLPARLAAIDTLETLGTDAAPAAGGLIIALGDRNHFVRWSAARTLGKTGPAQTEKSVPALAKLLADSDLDVALAAALALEHYGPEAADSVPSLIAALNGTDAEMQIAVMSTFESIGPAARPALDSLIELLRSPDSRVRQKAAETLGTFGTTAAPAETTLRGLLNDPRPEVRRAAAETLLNILPTEK